jgi:hypothetical protein
LFERVALLLQLIVSIFKPAVSREDAIQGCGKFIDRVTLATDRQYQRDDRNA